MSSMVSRRPPPSGSTSHSNDFFWMSILQAPPFRLDQPLERLLLDVDQVRDLDGLVEARERATRTGTINRSQDGDSSGGRGGAGEVRGTDPGQTSATRQNSTAKAPPGA